MDEKYVVSGSDDTNIRFWKAVANDPIKLVMILLIDNFILININYNS